jgi:polyhydroxyalkanoate synthesis regulator phasin
MESLKDLDRINESFSNFHLKLGNILKYWEMNCCSGNNQAKVLVDVNSIKNLNEIVEDLRKTDLLHAQTIKVLGLKVFKLLKSSQFLRDFQENLTDVRKKLENFKNESENQVKNLLLAFETQKNALQKEKTLNSLYNLKVKTCLALIFDPKSLKQKNLNFEQDLQENLKFDLNENLSIAAKMKKIKSFVEGYKKLVLCLGKELLAEISYTKNPENLNSSPLETVSKKTIVQKVNRLLNRGSLTKEEARRVINRLAHGYRDESKENKENKENWEEKLYSQCQQARTEESPLTETRVKPGKNKSTFQEELQKMQKIAKKSNKSCSVLKRRKSNNVSISRHLSISSFQKVNKRCN